MLAYCLFHPLVSFTDFLLTAFGAEFKAMDQFIAFSKAHHQCVCNVLAGAVGHGSFTLQFTIGQLAKCMTFPCLNTGENVVAVN